MSINEFEIEFDIKSKEHEIEFEEKANEHVIEINNEIDPTVPAHVKRITKEDIEKWNNPPTPQSDIELITEIKPESIEEDLEENQVYNGNAIHDLARLFGMTLEELKTTLPIIIPNFDIELTYEDSEVYNANAIHQLLELFVYEITMIQEGFSELYDAVGEIIEREPLVVTATFTLATQRLTNISHYYDKIKQAYDNGQDIKLKVTIAESGNIATADISVLDVSKKSAFFYPIMRTNIGFGNEIYFFDVEIKQNTGSLNSYVLQATGLGE